MRELRTDRYKLKDVFPKKAKYWSQRLHKKADEIEFIRKAIPIDPQEIKVEEGERAAIRLISTPRLDRDNEILIPNGVILDEFRESPSVLWAHKYDELPVGKDLWIKPTAKGILAKTQYANHAFAEDVFQCVKGGFLNANSAGFIPVETVTSSEAKAFKEWQERLEKDYGVAKEESDKAKNIYTKWILLEHSDVPVASNAGALNIAVSKGELPLQTEKIKKDLEIEIVKDDREIEIIREDKEIEVEIETKPETTENFHHIPVEPEGKHEGHRIRTITISADEGIKAKYCGQCKVIITYMFDVDKWTMEEAQAWVTEHKEAKIFEPEYKERLNHSLSKIFDIERVESPVPLPFNYSLFEKFLECKVKEIFCISYSIPCPLFGTYLAGFKEILKKFKLKDTRCFNWDGGEKPPSYEVISLNSVKSDDFLVEGMNFYDALETPLIVKYSPDWCGIVVYFITAMKKKEWNKELMDEVHAWVEKNNFLKGEKFSLCGEFLDKTDEGWDSLILDQKIKDILKTTVDYFEKKKETMASRGLLLIGPPGTGKTKTGRILMNKSNSTFIWISSRDFRNMGPLQALTLSFSMARDLAPTTLYIEDIDTWLREWGGEDSVIVDLLKTEMDGIRQNKGIITALTSNYPEKLPNALLDRPGRFHHIINFELPRDEQRKDMILLWVGKIEDELMETIVKETDGFSGAHIKELIEFASIIAEEEGIGMGEAIAKSLKKLIEQRELISEIRENKTNAKSFWSGIEWQKGNISMKKDKYFASVKIDIIEKGVIPYKDLGNADEGEAWDGPGEVAKAEVEDLKLMCTWFDSENPDLKTAYKLPHHKTDGHKAVWRGVANAAARLPQTDLPEVDMGGCEGHLGKHYKDFGKESPWEKMADEWKKYCELWKKAEEDEKFIKEAAKLWELLFSELNEEKEEEKSMFAEKLQTIIKLGDVEEWVKAFNDLKEQIAELKEDRMLNHENEQTIKDAITALQDVLKADKAGTLEGGEKAKEIKVEIEKAKEESLEEKVKRCVKNIDMDKLVKEAVDLRIKKIKGIVE